MGGSEGVILCRICSIVAENWVRDRRGGAVGVGDGGKSVSNECIWVNVRLWAGSQISLNIIVIC